MLNRAFKASTEFAQSAGFVQSMKAAWRLMPLYNRVAIGVEHRWLNFRGLEQKADNASASLKQASMNLLNRMLDQVERHAPESYDILWQSWPAKAMEDTVADYFYEKGLSALGEISQKATDNVGKLPNP
jgi:hypothetical protein